MDQATKQKYFPVLDGLRALGFLMVLLYHFGFSWSSGGYLGVVLFFTLSGFLITWGMEQKFATQKFELGTFYLRRVQRIMPALVAVVVGSTLMACIVYPPVLNGIKRQFVSALLGFSNWTQIWGDTSYFAKMSEQTPLTHLWSLSIEMQFYLVWPFVFAGLRKVAQHYNVSFKRLFLRLLMIVAAYYYVVVLFNTGEVNRVYLGTDTRIFAFLVGSYVAICLNHANAYVQLGLAKELRQYRKLLAGMLGILVLAWVFSNGEHLGAYLFTLPFFALFSGLLIIVANYNRVLSLALGNPVMTWLGVRSYGLYLYHYPVIFFYTKMGLNQGRWSDYLMMTVITVIISVISYHYLEQPFMSAKVDLTYKRRVRRTLIAGVPVAALCMMVASAGADVTQTAKALEANKAMLEQTQAKPVKKQKPAEFLFVGDSLMLGAAKGIKEAWPDAYVDAQQGRQANKLSAILLAKQKDGTLPANIVVGLGTNGNISTDDVETLLGKLDKRHHIYWINTYAATINWGYDVNKSLAALAEAHPKQLTLVDWDSQAKGHYDWLEPDRVHLNAVGQKNYVNYLQKKLPKTQ